MNNLSFGEQLSIFSNEKFVDSRSCYANATDLAAVTRSTPSPWSSAQPTSTKTINPIVTHEAWPPAPFCHMHGITTKIKIGNYAGGIASTK